MVPGPRRPTGLPGDLSPTTLLTSAPVSHTALARKYRPRRFSEVSTQEHVSETLRRAIAGNRVAHAYLFCGPRGVGKTTLARVLAMALNCPNRSEDGEPCGECPSCQRIWGGQTALDVVEIDAASNRGVDDARELRERAMYAPSEEGRYKVYILDEAHMLTREAWNALLKILEEPPARVIFIFATTEPQKIQQSASPILSRCQRFDFRRIGVGDITGRLQEVVEGEGVEAPDEALRTMARRADGGMRDALSLLDQVLALTGGEVSQEAVRRVLGLVEDERYLELLEILRARNHGRIFSFVEELLEEGYDVGEFHRGLMEMLRVLLRIRLDGPEAGESLSEEMRKAFGERVQDFAPGDLVRMLALATDLEASGNLRRSPHPQLLLEMLLLRLSYLDRTVDLETLLGELGGEKSPETRGDMGAPSGRNKATSGRNKATSGRNEAMSGTSGPPAPREKTSPGSQGPEPGPGAKPERGAAAATPVPLRQAWEDLLERPPELPGGVLPFLRAARTDFPGTDTVELHMPPGPGLEGLESRTVLAALKGALKERLDREVRVVVKEGAGSESTGERVTEETVRKGRLKELVDKEPTLEEAVQELDLELLD